eukprot:2042473-Prymnesium_polylepis.1
MLGARLAIQRARSALTQAQQGAEQCRAAALDAEERRKQPDLGLCLRAHAEQLERHTQTRLDLMLASENAVT